MKNVKTKITNKILSIFWCLIIAFLVPITAAAETDSSVMPVSVTTYSVGDYAALKSAIDTINTAGSGEYIITLTDDIVIDETSLKAITLNASVTVTLLGNGHSITGTGETNMFSVQNGATLVLGAADETDVLVLDADKKGYGIAVTKGTLKMYEGVTIKNTRANAYGGVYVGGANSSFYMYGGTITECHFIDSVGSDKGPSGILVDNGAHLEITGGTISNCSARKAGGGIYIDGNASANIRNAIITNNIVGEYIENPGTYKGMSYWGGGVSIGKLSGPMTIEKCEITNNKAYGWFGGGIVILNDSQNITIDSCLITGNSSWRYGGGAALLGYKVNESDGIIISNSTITGNTTGGGGGGIVNASNKLTLQNTAVYANHADIAGDDFVSLLEWVSDFKYVSTTLCAVPDGLTLTEDGKEFSVTGWYEDGNNTLGAEGTSLRWGDEYNGGYYCDEVPVPASPIDNLITLKAAYDFSNVHDHIYENWTSNTDGTHTGNCTVDGCSVTRTDICSGGTATCTTLAQCSVCGDEYGSEDSTNHADYGTELQNRKEATCTADGYTGDTCCKGCGALLEAGTVIPGGHSFETGWNYDENSHWHICAVCKSTDTKESHSYGDWVVTKEATTRTEGSREKACVCGYKIVESIAKIQRPNPTQTNAPQVNVPKTQVPQTGDNSNMMLWLALLLISGGAPIALTVCDRKRRKDVNSN